MYRLPTLTRSHRCTGTSGKPSLQLIKSQADGKPLQVGRDGVIYSTRGDCLLSHSRSQLRCTCIRQIGEVQGDVLQVTSGKQTSFRIPRRISSATPDSADALWYVWKQGSLNCRFEVCRKPGGKLRRELTGCPLVLHTETLIF